MDATAPRRHVDVCLVVTTVLISLSGLVMIYSARRRALEEAGLDPMTFVKRQAMAVVLGGCLMAVTALIDYRHFRDWAVVLFAATTVLLLAVLSPLGSASAGAQSWFQLGSFQLQPSELAKVSLVVVLAAVAAGGRGRMESSRLLTCLGVAAIPLVLIMVQPDLGTALVMVALVMGLLLVAGTQARHIVLLTMLGITLVVGVLHTDGLEAYQKARLTAFLDQGAGGPAYHVDQSKIALGSGKLTGKGLLNGTQTSGFVPEQHTDFIFTVVGEELGFVGAATLLVLFALLVWRIWRTAQLARDLYGTLLCAGVLAMIVFQIFENVGMTMGIMPITGIPLPLVSYGGSATLATFAALGLVLNVHMRRFT